MNKQHRARGNGHVRPIKTRRDYQGAAAVVKKLAGKNGLDSTAELRLKSLLHELDKFDDEDDADPGTDFPGNDDYSGPRRRWSDDGSDPTDS